jgi:hypothetical protein
VAQDAHIGGKRSQRDVHARHHIGVEAVEFGVGDVLEMDTHYVYFVPEKIVGVF